MEINNNHIKVSFWLNILSRFGSHLEYTLGMTFLENATVRPLIFEKYRMQL